MIGFMAFRGMRGINRAVGNYNKSHPYMLGDVRNMGLAEQKAAEPWKRSPEGRAWIAQSDQDARNCGHSQWSKHPTGISGKEGTIGCYKCEKLRKQPYLTPAKRAKLAASRQAAAERQEANKWRNRRAAKRARKAAERDARNAARPQKPAGPQKPARPQRTSRPGQALTAAEIARARANRTSGKLREEFTHYRKDGS